MAPRGFSEIKYLIVVLSEGVEMIGEINRIYQFPRYSAVDCAGS